MWRLLLTLTAAAWLLELVDIALGQPLNRFGIHPLNPLGLLGIVTSPFLHGGLSHLLSNTIPFLVLGWFVGMGSKRDFYRVSLVVVLLSGLGTWLIGGSGTVHIGASGVIFGYLGFILAYGLIHRQPGSLFISGIVFLSYSWMIFGLLPGTPGISWQGHLCGFVGGIVAAKFI